MNLKDTISFNTISPVFGVYLHMLVALFYLLGIHNIFASHKYIHQTCIRREIPPQTYVLVCSGLFDLSFLWRQCDYIYNVVIVTVFQFRFQGLCEWILRRMTYPSFMYPGISSVSTKCWQVNSNTSSSKLHLVEPRPFLKSENFNKSSSKFINFFKISTM